MPSKRPARSKTETSSSDFQGVLQKRTVTPRAALDLLAANTIDGDSGGGPLNRYLTVLELVVAFPDTITLKDVSAILGLPKSTAHRLLTGLTRSGLIENSSPRQVFRLGDRLRRLMHASVDEGWIKILSQPYLEALAARYGETYYIARLVGHRVIVAVRELPDVHWPTYIEAGIEMPPHAGASAKAILAYQSVELINKALGSKLPRMTVQTLTDPAQVKVEYEKVKTAGYATCISEIDEGMCGIAVPIRQANGAVLHSLGITGPIQRIMNNDLPERLEGLRETAKALSIVLSAGVAVATRT